MGMEGDFIQGYGGFHTGVWRISHRCMEDHTADSAGLKHIETYSYAQVTSAERRAHAHTHAHTHTRTHTHTQS